MHMTIQPTAQQVDSFITRYYAHQRACLQNLVNCYSGAGGV